MVLQELRWYVLFSMPLKLLRLNSFGIKKIINCHNFVRSSIESVDNSSLKNQPQVGKKSNNFQHSIMKHLVFKSIFSIMLGLLLALYMLIKEIISHPLPVSALNIIQVKKSMSASAFAQMLQDNHYIQNASLLRLMIRVCGYSQKLQAGIYQPHINDTAWQVVNRVVAGDVLMQQIRIAEGATTWQIKEQLTHVPYLNIAENDWLDAHAGEGLLLADTYTIEAGSSSTALLMRAHANLQHHLQNLWQNRDLGLPYKNANELLIAASIIEKEAALPDERRLISGIIVNRLQRNMPLQMDPTVIYGLGPKHIGSLTHNDLQIDSPYNSYRHRGLPPTPISMVSLNSLQAAAHPLLSNFLYFVAKGDGSHQFSVTYAEQIKAIQNLRIKV